MGRAPQLAPIAVRAAVRAEPYGEPVRPAGVLRVERLALEAQPTRHVRRLEPERELRSLIAHPPPTHSSGAAGHVATIWTAAPLASISIGGRRAISRRRQRRTARQLTARVR